MRKKAIIHLVVTMALVSLVVILAKQTLVDVPFFTFVWLQMVFACLVMLINTFVIQKQRWPVNISAKIYWMLIGIGLLNYLLVRLLFVYSLKLLPVTTHAYLLNFVGIVTMVLSSLLLREKPRMVQLFGATVAIFGLWIFFYESPKEGEIRGIVAVFFAVIFLAFTNILLRKLHLEKNHGLSHNHIATFAVCVGSIPLIGTGLIIDMPLPTIPMRLHNAGIADSNF